MQRVGAAVCCAVERFVAVGETIADDNPDVRHSMVLACKEARAAGQLIIVISIQIKIICSRHIYKTFFAGGSFCIFQICKILAIKKVLSVARIVAKILLYSTN